VAYRGSSDWDVWISGGRVVSTTLLRSFPGFPVETRGTDELHAVFFKGKPHTWSLPAARGRKSGSGRDDKERVVAYRGSCDWDVWISGGGVA
jgi:hypothetical protein